jgi:hypothetical protein
MQRRIIFNKFTGIWVLSTLMVTSTTVTAGGYSQEYPQYSQQNNSRQSDHRPVNPWLLPEKKEMGTEFQQYPDFQEPQYKENQHSQKDQQSDQQKQGFRFVTPEILESLKQQSSENQKMPGSNRSQQYRAQQPWQGGYGYSPYGLGYSEPLVGIPGISPWGGGPDLLYRGGEYPWAPYAGIGGIATTPAPSFNESSHPDDSENTENQEKQERYNVFDPYTLLPNRN